LQRRIPQDLYTVLFRVTVRSRSITAIGYLCFTYAAGASAASGQLPAAVAAHGQPPSMKAIGMPNLKLGRECFSVPR
jgi:hypothetical protein